MIQRGNAELPFEIIYDKTILEYMLQYASHIKYVIFKSDFITSIIKTAAIPQILNELDYSKICIHSIQGITVRYGFHIGACSDLPDEFLP